MNPESQKPRTSFLQNSSFEGIINFVLILMMYGVVILSTIDLGWRLVTDLITPPVFLLDLNELLDILGWFLLVLIAIELLETIKIYLHEHIFHAEIVMEVALIAVARKVIILDFKDFEPLMVIAISLAILALSVAHYLLKQHLVKLASASNKHQPPTS